MRPHISTSLLVENWNSQQRITGATVWIVSAFADGQTILDVFSNHISATAAADVGGILSPVNSLFDIGIGWLKSRIELAATVIVKTRIESSANLTCGQPWFAVNRVGLARLGTGIHTSADSESDINTTRTKD